MNERIKELAIDCAIQLDWDFPSDPKEYTFSSAGVEKFAELIVRECSKVIVNGGYRNPAFGEKHPLTPLEIAKMIREHFGVEE